MATNKQHQHKSTVFENIATKERYICDNPKNVALIEGVEFIEVYTDKNPRKYLMRKAALQKV